MGAEAAYAELVRRTREQALLASCAELLGWDEETCMPPGGIAHRARQRGLLAALLHDQATDPRLGDLLAVVEGSDLVRGLDCPAAVNVREIRRNYDRETRLPRALVEETARVTALAEQEWAVARRRSDFARFRPWLEKVIVLCRRYAEAVGGEPYDAQLDAYEPGLRAEPLTELFDALRRDLVPLANALTHATRRPPARVLRGPFLVKRQRAFVEPVVAALGFDFRAGRIDVGQHPFFSTIGPGDVRLATRFRAGDFCEGFYATLHEAGHGLYEQGLPAEHHGTPMGECPSVALHESQARLWENAVGRHRGFWEHVFPLARRAFPSALRHVTLDDFHFAVNTVEASLVRARADEVTYNLHILIRFELERALIDGALSASELPAAWNEAYRHYLGVTPASDAEGCLQDGHWGAGMFGYFPTYTLGNILAAQLFAAAEQGLGSVGPAFARGEFGELLGWLRANVHQHGGRWPVARLIERVTGSPPDPRPLVAYLRCKYGELYDVSVPPAAP